jgi:hypothetical protein
MNSKRGFETEYYSRGFTGSNGEDIPIGQSTRARMLIINIKKEDIDLDFLSEWQRRGREGVYARATAAYIRWLAARYEVLKKTNEVRHKVERARDNFARTLKTDLPKMHSRTPTTLADFSVGLDYFLTFATEIGAISKEEADAYRDRCFGVLISLAHEQVEHLRTADPTTQFLDLIRAAITSGRAHVCDVSSNTVPLNVVPSLWGWIEGREQTLKRDDGYEPVIAPTWIAKGDCIGWIEADHTGYAELFLEPTVAYNIAQIMGNSSGSAVGLSRDTLWDRLKEKRLLKRTDEKRTTIVKRIQGKGKRVVCLDASLISGVDVTDGTLDKERLFKGQSETACNRNVTDLWLQNQEGYAD